MLAAVQRTFTSLHIAGCAIAGCAIAGCAKLPNHPYYLYAWRYATKQHVGNEVSHSGNERENHRHQCEPIDKRWRHLRLDAPLASRLLAPRHRARRTTAEVLKNQYNPRPRAMSRVKPSSASVYGVTTPTFCPISHTAATSASSSMPLSASTSCNIDVRIAPSFRVMA